MIIYKVNHKASHLDAMQGKNEQRSKAYMKYGERVAQFLTPQGAKSTGGMHGFAGQQASAVGRLA